MTTHGDGPAVGHRPDRPRIWPLATEDQDEATKAVLGTVNIPGSPAHNVFTTLARHLGLLRKWLPAAGKLLAGDLDPRVRELAILRTAWRCGSDYEWGQHVIMGRRVGLDDAEVSRVKAGPDHVGWSSEDRAVLRAVDELHEDSCITDPTWAALCDQFDEHLLIELVMLVGQYHQVAFALNSFGVQREPGVPGFDL